jgi:nucleoside 2-deoxyribosyltransferase
MNNKTVYLAGPITGLSYGGCTDWRQQACDALAKHGITGLSPMRAKNYLSSLPSISGHGKEYAHMGVLSTPRAVTTRDRFDTCRADLVLVNLLGATQVSVGTMIELGWADASRNPVVCAIEPENNPHEHMIVQEIIGFRVPSLEEALNVCIAILTEQRA